MKFQGRIRIKDKINSKECIFWLIYLRNTGQGIGQRTILFLWLDPHSRNELEGTISGISR